MVPISSVDFYNLKRGLPPQSRELTEYLCIESDWLSLMQSYTIENVIKQGGSKLKILHGATGTGKSHFLKFLGYKAKDAGLLHCFLNLKEEEFFLSDPVQLYKSVVANFDINRLAEKLLEIILLELGYTPGDMPYSETDLLEFLMQKEGAIAQEAKKLSAKR